mmetsp:Transcript_84511/g.149600  ORF Transcript_84511/g.149600 Transcript_84511/m.149600 type:complete len:842 (-) Transcript_84511:234-2759(-)|eukprot:CAMPEP_0197655130 /NCGR_PEP_ID=MMETSP1338-20131121/39267_1 /TAXON_ID=43686 ORGANISM="Pelagodinium beii, Strain RCC1491" /NCGR_SAMPLE_ID=MMETSP1338 /ASSEMBLY_ACC=CAM_ASM_000754 /LENGTH=841 /DNA_ID=CAMNT_0043230715 /DNA_START=45 /DNA_END=2570 /DNA_ORIENTATION=-
MAANGTVETAKGNVLVFRGWGQDRPGIAEAFMKIVLEEESQVLDMAQFLLGDSLMFTFVLKVSDNKSIGLMRCISACAKELGLQLNFHFPDASQVAAEVTDSEAVITLVSSKVITTGLLLDVDKELSAQKCVVHEIEHRSDNKKENNGEYNKVQIRISCPKGLRLASLVMGCPIEPQTEGLQTAAWRHGAEVTARWWDAMNRPNGKSLVVFGLSNVLCPNDVLDEVLQEAGLDPKSVSSEGDVETAKLAMLKGKSVDLVKKVTDRLQYTDGAKVVCSALKRMGFRMAILTNTGMKEIVEHVKSQLGLDYAICRDVEVKDNCFTGNYLGELSDVKFRKADLLKLMAEREGIKYRNVITVGEPLKGLKAANARLMLETFGPNVFFNSTKNSDLTIMLYLLGFNGSDVRALRKRRWEDGPGSSDPVGSASLQESPKRFVVQVSSQTRTPGQLQRIFSPLSSLQNEVQLTTVRQCSLQDGGMCLGLDLKVLKKCPDAVVKELVYACQKDGFQVMDVNDAAKDFNWLSYYQNRYVVTLVQQPNISSSTLSEVLSALGGSGANIVKIERLSSNDLAALQLIVSLPNGLSPEKFASQMVEVSKKNRADIAIQRDDLERQMRRLVVFDMDSTLIQQEVIDELAKLAGVEAQVKEITEAAMRGDLDFFGSLKSRVALLKGHNADELFSKVKANLIFTPGAKKLCQCLRRLGFKTAVISGGFLPVAQEVQRILGLDYAFANTLEVEETTGLLTGKTSGPVVTPQRKRQLLATIANVEGCEIQQTIAVGDGANDIPMLHAAGLGIAFCAKPKVQEVSQFRINQMDLSTVLFLIGVSERAMHRLEEGREDDKA